MNFEEYQQEAKLTASYPRRLQNLEYPTLGLAGEAGEVANIVKKSSAISAAKSRTKSARN